MENNNPIMMITTEVPFPFLIIVLSMNESVPIKRAGTMACNVSPIGGTDTMAKSVNRARKQVITKQIT
jgi:hypothetical protein